MPFALLLVSLLLAAACALLNLWLMTRVGQVRRRLGISIGDGGAEPLVRRMRAQANFLESAPFVLALVALIEVAVGTTGWLAALAALFVTGRIAHPLGMDRGGWPRVAGTAATMLVLLLLALWAVAIPIVAATHREPGRPAVTVTPAA